jgi:hypothetical protein
LLVLNYIKLLFSLFLKATESDGWGCVCHAHNLNKQTLYSCTHLGAVRFKSYVKKIINFTNFQITSLPPPPPHTHTIWAAGLGAYGQQGGDQERPVGDVQVGVLVR